MKKPKVSARAKELSAGVGRSLRRAGLEARRVARMYGTPIYVMRKGKVVAAKP